MLGCFWPFSYVYTINLVLCILLLHLKEYRCLKKVIDQKGRKWMVAPFSAFYSKSWFLPLYGKTLFSWKFQFKTNRKIISSSKKGTRYFQNSPLFERSACFWDNQWKNRERFQYFNFETSFFKYFSFFLEELMLKVLRLKTQFFHTKLIFQKPMLRKMEW